VPVHSPAGVSSGAAWLAAQVAYSNWLTISPWIAERMLSHRLSAVVRSGTTQRFFIAFLTFPDGVREW
jgi:hypothetical protein